MPQVLNTKRCSREKKKPSLHASSSLLSVDQSVQDNEEIGLGIQSVALIHIDQLELRSNVSLEKEARDSTSTIEKPPQGFLVAVVSHLYSSLVEQKTDGRRAV